MNNKKYSFYEYCQEVITKINDITGDDEYFFSISDLINPYANPEFLAYRKNPEFKQIYDGFTKEVERLSKDKKSDYETKMFADNSYIDTLEAEKKYLLDYLKATESLDHEIGQLDEVVNDTRYNGRALYQEESNELDRLEGERLGTMKNMDQVNSYELEKKLADAKAKKEKKEKDLESARGLVPVLETRVQELTFQNDVINTLSDSAYYKLHREFEAKYGSYDELEKKIDSLENAVESLRSSSSNSDAIKAIEKEIAEYRNAQYRALVFDECEKIQDARGNVSSYRGKDYELSDFAQTYLNGTYLDIRAAKEMELADANKALKSAKARVKRLEKGIVDQDKNISKFADLYEKSIKSTLSRDELQERLKEVEKQIMKYKFFNKVNSDVERLLIEEVERTKDEAHKDEVRKIIETAYSDEYIQKHAKDAKVDQNKQAQPDPNQNKNGQPDPNQNKQVQPDPNQNGNGQNLGNNGDNFPMDMNFIKGVVKKSEYCSDQVFTLAQRALANRTWIGTCIANRRIAQAAKLGILTDEEKAIIQSARANTNVNLGKNAAFWQIAESLKDRIDNQKATNKVAEEIKQANQEKFDLENSYATGTKEEQQALLLYGKIKDMSRQEVENIRNTYAGDMRAVSAKNIQKLLDVELNRLTNNGWSKYQQDNPNKVVLSSDKDAIKALGISNDEDLKEASRLMQTRNYLQVIFNSNKTAEVIEENKGDLSECMKDEMFAQKYNESMTILANELKLTGEKGTVNQSFEQRDRLFMNNLGRLLGYSSECLRDNNIIGEKDTLVLDKETSKKDFEHAVAIYDKVDQIKKDVVSGLKHSERYEVYEGLGDQTVSPKRGGK